MLNGEPEVGSTEAIGVLVAAIVALWALKVAAKPAYAEHEFGHGKAEYMSSAVEGSLIFVAAAVIIERWLSAPHDATPIP